MKTYTINYVEKYITNHVFAHNSAGVKDSSTDIVTKIKAEFNTNNLSQL